MLFCFPEVTDSLFCSLSPPAAHSFGICIPPPEQQQQHKTASAELTTTPAATIASTTTAAAAAAEPAEAATATPSSSMLQCRRATDQVPLEYKCQLDYLGQGAANIVFSISPWDLFTEPVYFTNPAGAPVSPPFHSVLRIPKNLRKTISAQDTIEGLEEFIKPLFPGELGKFILGHELLKLEDWVLRDATVGYAPVFTATMAKEMFVRDPGEEGDSYSIPCFAFHKEGILLQNMMVFDEGTTEEEGNGKKRGGFMCEIKPKWLVPSPKQPVNSYRCRTCAMRASTGKLPGICPIDLAGGNERQVRKFLLSNQAKKTRALEIGHTKEEEEAIEMVVQYLCKGEGRDLIVHLAKLQFVLDPDYPENYERFYGEGKKKSLPDHSRRMAMTLRDCSMYIRVWPKPEDPKEERKIECFLGDLDFKHEDKLPDWRRKERDLRTRGWFTGKENESGELNLEENCAMARKFRANCPWRW